MKIFSVQVNKRNLKDYKVTIQSDRVPYASFLPRYRVFFDLKTEKWPIFGLLHYHAFSDFLTLELSETVNF